MDHDQPLDQPLRGRIASRLRAVAADLTGLADQQLPAPVILAHARRAFSMAGTISIVLDEESVPARNAYRVAEHQCRQALAVLDKTLGPHLIKRYAEGTRMADLTEQRQDDAFELHLSNDEDIDRIAAAMIALAAALQEILSPIADDDQIPDTLRRAARTVGSAAEQVWAHYGGDSGGW